MSARTRGLLFTGVVPPACDAEAGQDHAHEDEFATGRLARREHDSSAVSSGSRELPMDCDTTDPLWLLR